MPAGTPRRERPAPSHWFAPPDDNGQSFQSSETIRWLIGQAFGSRRAYSMLIASDAPSFRPYGASAAAANAGSTAPDGLVTSAIECLHERCAVPLTECARNAGCRIGWAAFAASQGRVPWNQSALHTAYFAPNGEEAGGDDHRLRTSELVRCFSAQCTCQARDALQHAVRFTGAASGAGADGVLGSSDGVGLRKGGGLDGEEIEAIFALARRIAQTTPDAVARRAFGIHSGGLSTPNGPDDGVAHASSPVAGATSDNDAGLDVAKGHTVTFLHSEFESALPALHAKLVGCARAAHDQHGWHVLREESMAVRTIELLEYDAQTTDSLGWHVDEQSAVTLLIMLSSPGRDFTGGELQHEVMGQWQPVSAQPALGDVTVYRSHQAHRVTPLVSGRRRVMAMELWHQRGAERPANARPHKPYGQCPA